MGEEFAEEGRQRWLFRPSRANQSDVTLANRIVAAVAEQNGVEPEALKTPLAEAVDKGVIEALDDAAGDGEPSPYPVVEFVYCGCTVWVDGNGNVTVRRQAGTTERDSMGRGSTETTYQPLDDPSGAKAHRQAAMREAADVIAARERPFEDRLEGLLEVVRTTLGVKLATLSYVNEGSYVFEAVDTTPGVTLRPGEVVALSDTVCQRVVETGDGLVFRDVLVDAPELAESTGGIASYIGVPVFVDGEVYGTFCFYDTDPREEEFSKWERTFVELLSQWVSSELERRHRERALQATPTERPVNQS